MAVDTLTGKEAPPFAAARLEPLPLLLALPFWCGGISPPPPPPFPLKYELASLPTVMNSFY